MPTINMCSASQPSVRACQLAMRNAWHFLPSKALPPYPEPKLLIDKSSGKCMMKRRCGLRSPVECNPRTKVPSRVMRSSADRPMRVMRCMLSTT